MNSSTGVDIDPIAKLAELLMRLNSPRNCHSTTAFTTTASCIFFPTGVVPQLPVELIHRIVGLSDPKSLHTLCLVNSVFQEVAVTRLYDHSQTLKPATLVRCLQTLSGSPELAGYTRSFVYGRFLGGIPHEHSIEYMTYFTTAFGMLLGNAMSNLSHLTSLTVQLLGPIGKYLRGAPFRLVKLDTTADWDADFVAFLEEQPSIRSFIHHGKHRPDVQVPPSALPNLSFIDSWPSLVSVLLAGRPVKDILLTCLSSTIIVDENPFQDLGRLGKLSTGPISVVSVINAVPEVSPADLFRLLAPIADNLSDVRLFHYNTCAQGLDEQSCAVFCEFLGRFKRLCRLRLVSSAPTDVIHSRDGQRGLLTSLIEHCPPTFWHVTFNGKIYARHSTGKWMTIEDLVEALEMEQKEAVAKEAAEEAPGASQSDSDEPNAGPAEVAG